MGIWGLQSYMRKSCENGYEFVNLKEISTLYRCDTGKRPIMLLDFSSSLFSLTNSDTLERLMIGGLKKFKRDLEEFINNCYNLGIHLIVMGQGTKTDWDHKKWIKNNKENVQKLKQIYVNSSFCDDWIASFAFLVVAKDIFETLDKCEYVGCLRNKECSIFDYAKRFNCFAILTDNSDFIFAEGAKYCLSAKDLNIYNMTTYNYNRNNLAKELNIGIKQIPIYGSLLRSAFQDPLDKPSFCFKNGIIFKNRFEKIAKLVTILPSGEEVLKKFKDYKNYLQMNEDELSRWNENLQFYYGPYEFDLAYTENEGWNEILSMARKRHVEGVGHHALLGILFSRTIYISPLWSNILKPLPDSAILPLRKTIYGILLSEHPDVNVSVTENRFDYDEVLKSAKFNTAVVNFVRKNHPGLLQLWSPNPSENTKKVKREIFCQAIDEKLNPDDLIDIKEELLFPFLAVFYLFSKLEKKIQEFDVRVLLIQAVLSSLLSEKEIEKYPTIFQHNAFELSDWFFKAVNNLYILNSACGNPFCTSKISLVNFFDGKILHSVYSKEKTQFKMNDSQPWDPKVSTEFEYLRSKLYQLRDKLSTSK